MASSCHSTSTTFTPSSGINPTAAAAALSQAVAAMQSLAGHPQVTLYCNFILAELINY